MSAVRCFCLGLMLASVGVAFPTAAYANETAANETTDLSEASQPVESSISRGAPLDLEILLSQAEDELLTYEHTFSGYENEVVVAYWESSGVLYGSEVALYDSAGQRIFEIDHPGSIDLSEFNGRNRAYRLPETGEYQFVFTSSLEDALTQANRLEYLLRLRVASFYERAMMLAVERLDDNDFDGARLGFEMAIEQRPESPMPYLGRLITLWSMASETSSEVNPIEAYTLDGLYRLFQDLDDADQALVLADMQQVLVNFMAAVDAGVADIDTLEFDVSLINDFSGYLKTGEASEALQEVME